MNKGILFPVFMDSLAIFILFFSLSPFPQFPHFSLIFFFCSKGVLEDEGSIYNNRMQV